MSHMCFWFEIDLLICARKLGGVAILGGDCKVDGSLLTDLKDMGDMLQFCDT